MLVQQQKMILSPYMEIYDMAVPENILLRKINELVDFDFIYDELVGKYCLDNGRNAVSPIKMFKYFLEMAPEDEVINPSSLTKFRKLRLKDMYLLDLLISKTVDVAIEKRIIKSKVSGK